MTTVDWFVTTQRRHDLASSIAADHLRADGLVLTTITETP